MNTIAGWWRRFVAAANKPMRDPEPFGLSPAVYRERAVEARIAQLEVRIAEVDRVMITFLRGG